VRGGAERRRLNHVAFHLRTECCLKIRPAPPVRRRQPRRAAVAHARQPDPQSHEVEGGASHVLCEIDRGAAQIEQPARHDQLVVESGRREKVGDAAAHDEQNAVVCRQPRLLHTETAQHLGAGALGEAQITGVVDEAAGIGVLVVDPHREQVRTALEGRPRAD
jgi:hypothetical protein